VGELWGRGFPDNYGNQKKQADRNAYRWEDSLFILKSIVMIRAGRSLCQEEGGNFPLRAGDILSFGQYRTEKMIRLNGGKG